MPLGGAAHSLIYSYTTAKMSSFTLPVLQQRLRNEEQLFETIKEQLQRFQESQRRLEEERTFLLKEALRADKTMTELVAQIEDTTLALAEASAAAAKTALSSPLMTKSHAEKISASLQKLGEQTEALKSAATTATSVSQTAAKQAPKEQAKKSPVQWKKTTLYLVGDEERIQDVAARIDENLLEPQVKSLRESSAWKHKHHPYAWNPRFILKILLAAGEKGVSFQELQESWTHNNRGCESLQGYLRELCAQGLVEAKY